MDELENINSISGVKRQRWSVENSGAQINESVLVYLDKLWRQRTDTLIPVPESEYFDMVGDLDARIEKMQRVEQSFLRSKLFRDSKYAECCICGERMPIQLLVCAHIKKRSECTDDEKRDYGNVVAPMCRLGCDELYERKYLSVKDGRVVCIFVGDLSDKVSKYLFAINGRYVQKYDSGSKKYFDWHYETST